MRTPSHRFSALLLVMVTISLLTAGCYETSYQNRYHHHSRRYFDRRHTPPPPGVQFEMDVRH